MGVRLSGARWRNEDRCIHDIEIEPGMLLRMIEADFFDDGWIEGPIDRLGLSCVLSGRFAGRIEGVKDVAASSGQFRVFFWTESRNVRLHVPKHTQLRSVQLLVGSKFLASSDLKKRDLYPDRLHAFLTKEKQGFYTEERPLPSSLRVIAEQILDYDGHPATSGVFYRGKALELLGRSLDEIATSRPSAHLVRLRDDDIERVRQAKQLLLDNTAKPPSLPSLSRAVGLNEFKLKQGFRLVYNTTAYALLTDARMGEAERLLKSGRFTVTQAAFKVGYSSNAAFSRAFRRSFGYPPSALLRNPDSS